MKSRRDSLAPRRDGRRPASAPALRRPRSAARRRRGTGRTPSGVIASRRRISSCKPGRCSARCRRRTAAPRPRRPSPPPPSRARGIAPPFTAASAHALALRRPGWFDDGVVEDVALLAADLDLVPVAFLGDDVERRVAVDGRRPSWRPRASCRRRRAARRSRTPPPPPPRRARRRGRARRAAVPLRRHRASPVILMGDLLRHVTGSDRLARHAPSYDHAARRGSTVTCPSATYTPSQSGGSGSCAELRDARRASSPPGRRPGTRCSSRRHAASASSHRCAR